MVLAVRTMTRIVCVCVCVVLVSAVTAGYAQGVSAVGDGVDLWLVTPGTAPGSAPGSAQDATPVARTVVFHRRVADPRGQVEQAAELVGQVASAATACGGGRLWLIYDDHAVQSISFDPEPEPGSLAGPYGPGRGRRRLPSGVRLLSLAANRLGPWALVRVEDAQTLALIDRPVESEPPDEGRPDDSGLQPSEQADQAEAPVEPEPAEQRAYVPVERLLRLDRGRWGKFDLPADWPSLAPAWVVMGRPDDGQPILVALVGRARLLVYRWHNGQWEAAGYNIGDVDADRLQPIAVSGQLVLGRAESAEADLSVALSVFRAGQMIELGTITVPGASGRNWAIAPSGQCAALIGFADTPVQPEGEPKRLRYPWDVGRRAEVQVGTWTSMDLSGQLVGEAVPLTVAQPPLPYDPGRVLVVSVLALSMLLMFTFWRRDPVFTRIRLPEGVVLADLARRAVAAAIDIAPGMAVTGVVFEVGIQDLIVDVSGAGGDWHDLAPPLTVIGITVVHTALAEIFTARTLGKAICKLRVVTLDGGPPNLWQALARNLMRAFDMIAWYVLPILVVLGPYRQRLGDMAARTIVIADVPPGQVENKDQTDGRD